MKGAIAAGHPATAEAGASILREGGNAWDAALGAVCVAFVAEPLLCSPAGGGFLLARAEGVPPRIFDFFVQTPARRPPLEPGEEPPSGVDFRAIEADFGPARQIFHVGRASVAVPGVVAGLFAVHRALGSIPMRELVAPAIELAREGVEVSPFSAYLYDVLERIYGASPECLALFGGGAGRTDGRLPRSGDRLRLPELADTLDVLAREGPGLFYRGEIAALIEQVLGDGGLVDRADLEAYEVLDRHPLAFGCHGARVLTNPPPASGGALVGVALRHLERGDPPPDPGSPEGLARMAEALAAAAALRAEIVAEGGLDAARLAAALGEARGAGARGSPGPGTWGPPSGRGTTHISVMDARGGLASVTVSNGEGAGIVIPGTGIVLNNMLGEEDLNPGGFHRWPARTRMSSMMAPALIEDRRGGRVVTGSGGSNRIRSALAQVIYNLVAHRMALEEAVLAPRIHVEDTHLSVEGGFDPQRLGPLLDAYPEHQVWAQRNMFFGGAHSVALTGRRMQAVGDPRRAGVGVTV